MSALPLAVAGWIVLIGAWVAIVQLQARSPWLVLAAMAIVWIADTAAYFAGRAFGRRKLAPQISPGKTWEGVYGGLAAVALYALALVPLAASGGFAGTVSPLAVIAWVGCALALAALSVVGDLCESLLKRQAGVKDSGRLLPGHGGILDRVDALLAAMPAAALLALGVSAMIRRKISVLGATGSIGDSTLDVIRRHPERFGVAALTAHGQWEKLAQLCLVHRPDVAVLSDPAAALKLEAALAGARLPTRVLAGEAGLVEAASLAERRHRRRGNRGRCGSALDTRRGCAPASASCSRTRRRSSSAARRS